MNPNKILSGLQKLQKKLQSVNKQENEELLLKTVNENLWFVEANVLSSIEGISSMLITADLQKAIDQFYSEEGKNVGLILAGNIPAVGFQDILYVLLSGATVHVKLSSQDTVVIKYLVSELVAIDNEFGSLINFTDKLNLDELDAVLATGTDNTSRYFEQYFKKVAHIVRKNRTSVAVLDGFESQENIEALAIDITKYFGLGCRNVTKLFVPKGYDMVPLLKEVEENHKYLSWHSKYNNNYDYYKAVFLVNKKEHLDNGVLLAQKEESLFSPVAVLYYQEYTDLNNVTALLEQQSHKIQVVVSNHKEVFNRTIPFGQAQSPGLFDFPDGENVLEFLRSI